MERAEHCSFAKLNKEGKCIAKCSHNKLIDGYYIDCIDIRSDTIEEYCKRVNEGNKLH